MLTSRCFSLGRVYNIINKIMFVDFPVGVFWVADYTWLEIVFFHSFISFQILFFFFHFLLFFIFFHVFFSIVVFGLST